MNYIKKFEKFSEMSSEDDVYLILADFIEEDNCKIDINHFGNYFGLEIDRSNKKFYYNIVERLIDHNLHVICSRKKFWKNKNLKNRKGLIYASTNKIAIQKHFDNMNYSTNKDWEFEIVS